VKAHKHALPYERIDQRSLEVPECPWIDSDQLSDFRAAVRHEEVPPMGCLMKGLRPPQAAARWRRVRRYLLIF
jgi:hypothetical protein